MIKSLSPYYLTFPLVSPATGLVCTSYTLNLYIYDGLKDEQPAEPTYEITKQNASLSEGNEKINIARLVNDFVNFKPNKITPTGLIPANNQAWVRSEIVYNTGDPIDEGFPQSIDTQLMLKGYGYGMEGENAQPLASGILIRNDEFKVSRNTVFTFPFIISEPSIDPIVLVITNVVNNAPNDFDIFFTTSRALTNLTVYARNFGDPDFLPFIPFDLNSPINLTNFFSDSGDWEFQLSTYDPLLNVTVFSNIFRLTL